MKKNQNRKNFIWNTIGLTINSFISLFYLVIITRINGIKDAGMFSFVFTLSLILYNICLYGGRVYQVSDINGEFTDQQYFSLKHVTNLLALIILIICSIIFEFTLVEFVISSLLMFMKILDSYSDTIYGIFQKNDRLEYVGKSLIIKTIFSLFCFFIVDLVTNNIVLSIGISFIPYLIIYIFYDYKKVSKYIELNLKFDLVSTKKILNVTKYMCFFSLLTLLITNVPRFVIERLLDAEYQGYFSIIIMIPTAIVLLGQFVLQPEVVSLTKGYKEKNTQYIKKCLNKIIFIIIFISIICSIVAYLIGPLFLSFVYGLDFSNYSFVLIIVVLGGMFNIIATAYAMMLTIMRKTKIEFYIYLCIFLISIVITVLCIKYNQFYGAFAAYFITMFFEFAIFYIFYSKYIKELK